MVEVGYVREGDRGNGRMQRAVVKVCHDAGDGAGLVLPGEEMAEGVVGAGKAEGLAIGVVDQEFSKAVTGGDIAAGE